MTRLLRIRDTGSEADRALLQAQPEIPPDTEERVFRRLEARIDEKHRAPLRWRLVLMATLLAGTALAFGTGGMRAWFKSSSPQLSEPAPKRGKTIELPAALPVLHPQTPTAPARRAVARPRSETPSARPIERPELNWPPAGSGLVEPAGAAGPTPSSSYLVVAREGRQELRLLASASSVSGQVRGTDLSLRLDGSRLHGRIGGASVELWLRGPRRQGIVVEGLIDGRESGFVLQTTSDGHLLQGSIPGHTVRVALGDRVLSWLPGCDENLPAVAPGIYEGHCGSGRRARVEVPSAFSQMPVAHRMIVLAILLTETDPVFKYATPRLFPAEK